MPLSIFENIKGTYKFFSGTLDTDDRVSPKQIREREKQMKNKSRSATHDVSPVPRKKSKKKRLTRSTGS
eukprot:CAMPEP_0206201930 /NCGR_PEP_ID=MMETSP0166-20121206/11853_1 /ASSEMBLY_ACC=CAM_ASM_000260 /TAXON_ID=95228 /ORGANISM="Vannella robusta, Strain DIVA3 518/3/11/1/6" /LENGTH=68 /DNA_ID=CAMNT_0053620723 /DNA_START=9 /DNA_END=215 /DNA_ORIENTATION=+